MGVKRSRSDSVSSLDNSVSPFTRETSADVKIVHLDAETAVSAKRPVMKCSLPPHEPRSFASFEEYEVHYQQMHMNRCSECRRNFPDEHFLHLHIAENHDPITAAKKDRGEKTFACLLPTCSRPCSTPQKRRLHCIDKHSFPRNYDFYIVNTGIDRRHSMLRPQHRRRSSTITSNTGNANDNRGHRRRSSTMTSTTERDAREGMDVVDDEVEEDGDEDEDEDDDEDDDDMADERGGPKLPQRAPIKLRGRGGFGHPSRARGAGRGRGRGRGHGRGASQSSESAPATAPAIAADPMEGLTSGMSALQFVPHSVHMARGRERGRGGAA